MAERSREARADARRCPHAGVGGGSRAAEQEQGCSADSDMREDVAVKLLRTILKLLIFNVFTIDARV